MLNAPGYILKKKLLSPTHLKEFRLQQEEEKKLRAAASAKTEQKILREENEKSRLLAPKEILEDQMVESTDIQTSNDSMFEMLFEKLENGLNEISSLVKQPSVSYSDEIKKLEIALSTKEGVDKIHFDLIETRLQEIKNHIPKIPEIRSYDEEISLLQKEIRQLKEIKLPEFPEIKSYDSEIESLTERVDGLLNTGNEIFKRYNDNLDFLKSLFTTVRSDLDNLFIPEEFDPSEIQQDILNTKEVFDEKISFIHQTISELPEVKYYDGELNSLNEKIENVRSSIPVIPEIRYYDDQLDTLVLNIEEVRQSVSNLPEIRHYEDEISNLKNTFEKITNEINSLVEERANHFLESLNQTQESIQKEISEREYLDLIVTTLEKDINQQQSNIEKIDEHLEKNYQDVVYLREEIFSEIEKINSHNYEKSIRSIERKLSYIENVYENLKPEEIAEQVLQESLVTEPASTNNPDILTPLNQNFVTLDQLQQHYRTFLNRIQIQLSTLGGGGETRLKYLDDIVGIATNASAYDGLYLQYNHSLGKFEFTSVAGGGGSTLSVEGSSYTINSSSTSTTKPTYVGVNSTSAVTINLHSISDNGVQIIIKDESGNAGQGSNKYITIVASDGQTIDGQASVILAYDYGSITLYSINSVSPKNWSII